MNREKNFLKNILILGIGNLFPKLATFFTLPILTANLSKLEYGTYDLVTSIVMLMLPIATLQIQSAAFRFLIDDRNDLSKSMDIVTNALFITFPISAIGSFFVQFFFFNYSMIIRIFISLYMFADIMYLTFGQIARGLGKNKDYSIASTILAVIDLVCVIGFVKINNVGLLGVLLSLTMANAIAFIYMAIKIKVNLLFSIRKINIKVIRGMIAYSWPMIPNNLSNWILKLSDRLVITAVLGIEANAIYAVANKLPNILTIAQTIMTMAWQENAAISAADSDSGEYYSKMLDRSFCVLFGFTALLIAGVPFIFHQLIKGEYNEAYYQIPILILAVFFSVMASFLGGIYIALKRTANVAISTMFAGIINLGVDLIFVKRIGIYAGSISTLLAYFALYIYRIWNIQKFKKIKVNILKHVMQLFLLIVMLFLCFFRQLWMDCMNVFIGITVFLIFNKDLISNLHNKIEEKSKGV